MRAIVPRADRVLIPISLTYRVAGDDHWLHGRVANLSESGVLFGPSELQPGVRLELIISSPIPVRTMAPGRMVCMARVVRTTEAGATGALFETCRFVVEN
jgi:PilZ domain-containing protein